MITLKAEYQARFREITQVPDEILQLEQPLVAELAQVLTQKYGPRMEALLIEFLVAAERAGIRGDLWGEVTALFASQPFEKVALNWVRTHSGAHARRRDEIKQVAGVLRSLGVEPIMTTAALGLFERSGRLGLAPAPTADDVIRFFNERP